MKFKKFIILAALLITVCFAFILSANSTNKSSKIMNFGMSILYYLVESLEDLGDELKQLGAILSKINPDKDILNILDKMNEMFRISYEFFYKPEKNKAVRAFKLNKELSSLIDTALETKNKEYIKKIKAG